MNTTLYYKVYLWNYACVTAYRINGEGPGPTADLKKATDEVACLIAISMANYDGLLGNETLPYQDFVKEFNKRMPADG